MLKCKYQHGLSVEWNWCLGNCSVSAAFFVIALTVWSVNRSEHIKFVYYQRVWTYCWNVLRIGNVIAFWSLNFKLHFLNNTTSVSLFKSILFRSFFAVISFSINWQYNFPAWNETYFFIVKIDEYHKLRFLWIWCYDE